MSIGMHPETPLVQRRCPGRALMDRTAEAARVSTGAARHLSMMLLALSSLLLLLCGPFLPFAAAASGTDPPWLLGQTAVFSGSNLELGRDMRLGLLAAIEEANGRTGGGGTNGRAIELISLDDGYEPGPALQNAGTLLNQSVLAVVGTVGTPTASAIAPLLASAGVPLVGAFTGARFLRSPYVAGVVNLRPSYDSELHAFVAYALARGMTRFSILYQNDGFGQAGLDALQLSLANQGLAVQSSATYERNTLEVAPAWEALSQGLKPEVCVLIGTARALAAFIALARAASNSTSVGSGPGQSWSSVLFGTVSFVGSEVLAQEMMAANLSLDNLIVM